MHVLYLPSWYPSHEGDLSGVFFREQALALANSGHQVGVISPNLKSLRAWRNLLTAKRGVEHQLDAGLATFRSFGTMWSPRPPQMSAWLWLLHGRKLFELYVARYGLPDLIHVHSMLNAGVLAKEIKDQYEIPYVVTEHSSAYARGRFWPGHLKIARDVASAAAMRLGVSQSLCRLLRERLGAAAGPWQEIPNIVERRFLAHPMKTRSVSDGSFQFVCVAALKQSKGIHDLLHAFAHEFHGNPLVTLEIGGDGVERQRLEALAAQLGVQKQVRFLGALDRDEVVKVMTAADALVHASHFETFGVVVIEALALGKPVIATRCGGPESIIRDEDGVLVPVGDIVALGDAMQHLRANHLRYRAEEIRCGCASRYSEEIVVARLVDIYGQVIK